MERRRVVITGLGAGTPIGLTAMESWQAVKDGVCGVAPITQFDPTGMKVQLAAEVKGFVPENYMSKPEAKRMARFTQLAVVSAKEALENAGFTLDEAEADRCGVIVSSGIGGLFLTEAEHDKGKEKGWDRVSPFYIPMGICNMAAGQIAIHTGFRGICSCPVTACTGGTNAVGDAFHYIRDGYADVMLSGGAKAMEMAIADAGAKPEDVDYINAHGTSTPLNDAGETAAVKTVFGDHAYQLAISSTKSMTGHMLGAAGAVEALFCALALQEGFLPATIHYQVPDPACDLDVVPNQGRSADLRYALSNSLGFGGHNGSLLFKKWEA